MTRLFAAYHSLKALRRKKPAEMKPLTSIHLEPPYDAPVPEPRKLEGMTITKPGTPIADAYRKALKVKLGEARRRRTKEI